MRLTLLRRMYIPKRKEVIVPGLHIRESQRFFTILFLGIGSAIAYFFSLGFTQMQRQPRYSDDSDFMKRRKGTRIVIIGGGAGGCCAASLLVNFIPDARITILERSKIYKLLTYVPLATVGHRSYDLRAGAVQTLEAMTSWMAPKEAKHVLASPTAIDPVAQTVTDSNGKAHEYDYLIVASGAEPDLTAVRGLKRENVNVAGIAMDPGYSRDFLGSIYHGECVVARVVPTELYRRTCDANFLGVINNVWRYLFYFAKLGPRYCNFTAFTGDSTASDMLPSAYIDELKALHTERGTEVRTDTQLVEVIPDRHTAVFQNQKTKELTTLRYSYLYLDLPLKVAEPMASVLGARTHGFIDVDHRTLQHTQYKNVFALGDCAAVPTIKSYAAAFAQAPVVVHNIMQSLGGYPCTAAYDGYSAFPMQMTTWRWMWPEVSFGKKRENFHLWDNAAWRDWRGLLNGICVQEAVYELHFWLEEIAGQFHPQHWWLYPTFEFGDGAARSTAD